MYKANEALLRRTSSEFVFDSLRTKGDFQYFIHIIPQNIIMDGSGSVTFIKSKYENTET